jgi:aminopeptidase N
MARRVVTGLFPRETTLATADAWLAANTDAPGALRRLIVEQRDHLARDLRAQEFNSGFGTRTPSDEP